MAEFTKIHSQCLMLEYAGNITLEYVSISQDFSKRADMITL
jgi:hypothetical protein